MSKPGGAAKYKYYLRKKSFILNKILGFGSRTFKKFGKPYNSQHLWSDAIFVKDFTKLDKLTDRQILVYIIIMFEIYKSYDFVSHLFSVYGANKDKYLVRKYLDWIS